MTGRLDAGEATAIVGYTDRLSYHAGEVVTAMAHASAPTAIDVELVALAVAGGGDGEQPVPWGGAGRRSCRPQRHAVGSFVAVDGLFDGGLPETFTWGCWICPTAPDAAAPQGIMGVADRASGAGVALAIERGELVLSGRTAAGAEAFRVAVALPAAGEWQFVAATVTERDAAVVAVPVDRRRPARPSRAVAARDGVGPLASGRWFTIGAGGAFTVCPSAGGAHGRPRDGFNGKIEAPFVLRRGLRDGELAACAAGDTSAPLAERDAVVAAWSFEPEPGPLRVVRDVVGDRHGVAVNVPVSGVTGLSWSGAQLDFARAPAQYAALHFHDDAVGDLGWEPLVAEPLPADLPSGLYGVRLRSAAGEDLVPFTVAPSAPTQRALVIVPTFTYLAYANETMFEGDTSALLGREAELDRRDAGRAGRAEFGLSQYDCHRDGSGVVFSSARRPIMNMRVDYRCWLHGGARGLSADLLLLRWLARRGIGFDLATDLELDRRQGELVDGYDVVVTGSHPEYCTGAMLDALEQYRDRGGNLVYLGGNGFYQVTAVYGVDPLITEIRRGVAGVRAWESPPGEGVLAATGEPGGLWRHRGRPPQQLVGVGFCAQGWDRGSPYRRTEASYAEEVAWIFAGVDGELIGSAGAVMGGAAGDELDRADRALGTPERAVVLASSEGHSRFYQRVVEEVPQLLPGGSGGDVDPEVRADVVYVPGTDGSGAVFSVGSIAWTGGLASEAGDPAVSRITENVLRRFGA